MVINTNISAQSAASLLGQSSSLLSKSLARLSSGSKITSPADDSAGLGVSMKLGAQIGRTSAASNNLANALSFSQTQDGYLSKMGDALTRMSELAVSAQDVTKTTSDRSLYNQEFQTLGSFINAVATKDFNGVSLFSGNTLDVTTDSEGGLFSMSGISANYIPITSSSTSTTTNTVTAAGSASASAASASSGSTTGYQSSTQAAQILSAFNGSDTNANNAFINMNAARNNWLVGNDAQAHAFAVIAQTAANAFAAAHPHDLNGLATQAAIQYQVSNQPGTQPGGAATQANNAGAAAAAAAASYTATTTTTTITSAMDISSVQGAASALTTIKSAVSQLASDRATLGANMERMNYTSSQLSTLTNNLSAAKSQITDVDVATESTIYARQNILVQSGTAMLAQANSAPQSVLRLLS